MIWIAFSAAALVAAVRVIEIDRNFDKKGVDKRADV